VLYNFVKNLHYSHQIYILSAYRKIHAYKFEIAHGHQTVQCDVMVFP